ncbi:MAG TPA: hypothetical protein VN081_04780 [Dongiaceae bacterium]|nr:hypothetical protein [Dongiaceae bacterium]
MESTLVLYRGDYQKIREFDINKANKHCLVGQGIYLTDSLKVANTYRTKGYGIDTGTLTLVNGRFISKGHAQEAAFQKYMEYTWKQEYGTELELATKQAKANHRLSLLPLWEDLLRGNGKLKIEAQRDTRGSYWNVTITLKTTERAIGRVSVFAFDNANNAFDNKVVNLSKVIQDKKVREVMAGIPYFNPLGVPKNEYVERFIDYVLDHGINVCPGATTQNTYGRYRWTSRWSAVSSTQLPINEKEVARRVIAMQGGQGKAYNKLSKRLASLDYLGYEYAGGLITNNISHRAFSLWDDDFVNEHFIERRC